MKIVAVDLNTGNRGTVWSSRGSFLRLDKNLSVSCTLSLTLYLPCTVDVPLVLVSFHQPHGPQGLPLSLCWDAAFSGTVGPPPPVAPPTFAIHLHGDWLAILVHKVQLLPASVMGSFTSLRLTAESNRKQNKCFLCD